jgi:hypothetical protein
MASIGGIAVTTWSGRIIDASREVGLLTPEPGVDGHALALDAWRANAAEITTSTDYATLFTARAAGEACRKLHGYSVSCEDPLGKTWENIIVMRVEYQLDLILTGKYRLTVRWKLLPMWSAA